MPGRNYIRRQPYSAEGSEPRQLDSRVAAGGGLFGAAPRILALALARRSNARLAAGGHNGSKQSDLGLRARRFESTLAPIERVTTESVPSALVQALGLIKTAGDFCALQNRLRQA